jgi:SAM-dependent methyltransferase
LKLEILMPAPNQKKQSEWAEQWSMFEDKELFLFQDWIEPYTLDLFRDSDVLECDCGQGQHTTMVAPLARSITAVDLNCAHLASDKRTELQNVSFVEADLATMELGRQFDVVFCIGVIHHTDSPDRTFANLLRHCRPGGVLIVWTYSAEGNELVRWIVEPIRKAFLRRLPRSTLAILSTAITAALYPAVFTVYRLPFFRFLPYYEYFQNFRRLSFKRNDLNVFDKLNAPQTIFTTRAKCSEWFNSRDFEPASISILPYKGVSYSLSGRRRG